MNVFTFVGTLSFNIDNSQTSVQLLFGCSWIESVNDHFKETDIELIGARVGPD